MQIQDKGEDRVVVRQRRQPAGLYRGWDGERGEYVYRPSARAWQAISQRRAYTKTTSKAGNVAILRGLDQANRYGILTDANLSGKTTVAQVQALFTAEDPSLPLTYALSLPN